VLHPRNLCRPKLQKMWPVLLIDCDRQNHAIEPLVGNRSSRIKIEHPVSDHERDGSLRARHQLSPYPARSKPSPAPQTVFGGKYATRQVFDELPDHSVNCPTSRLSRNLIEALPNASIRLALIRLLDELVKLFSIYPVPKDANEALGMTEVFDPNVADFSRICPIRRGCSCAMSSTTFLSRLMRKAPRQHRRLA
jgi:hypothetical protein